MSAVVSVRAFLAKITPVLEQLWRSGVEHDAVIAALKALLVAARKKTDADIAKKRR